MNNHVCYANWFLSAALLRIMFHNYNRYLLKCKSAFLPPSPFERGLQLLQEPVCLAGLEGSAFARRSEFAGPGAEEDPSAFSQRVGIGFSSLRCWRNKLHGANGKELSPNMYGLLRIDQEVFSREETGVAWRILRWLPWAWEGGKTFWRGLRWEGIPGPERTLEKGSNIIWPVWVGEVGHPAWK